MEVDESRSKRKRTFADIAEDGDAVSEPPKKRRRNDDQQAEDADKSVTQVVSEVKEKVEEVHVPNPPSGDQKLEESTSEQPTQQPPPETNKENVEPQPANPTENSHTEPSSDPAEMPQPEPQALQSNPPQTDQAGTNAETKEDDDAKEKVSEKEEKPSKRLRRRRIMGSDDEDEDDDVGEFWANKTKSNGFEFGETIRPEAGIDLDGDSEGLEEDEDDEYERNSFCPASDEEDELEEAIDIDLDEDIEDEDEDAIMEDADDLREDEEELTAFANHIGLEAFRSTEATERRRFRRRGHFPDDSDNDDDDTDEGGWTPDEDRENKMYSMQVDLDNSGLQDNDPFESESVAMGVDDWLEKELNPNDFDHEPSWEETIASGGLGDMTNLFVNGVDIRRVSFFGTYRKWFKKWNTKARKALELLKALHPLGFVPTDVRCPLNIVDMNEFYVARKVKIVKKHDDSPSGRFEDYIQRNELLKIPKILRQGVDVGEIPHFFAKLLRWHDLVVETWFTSAQFDEPEKMGELCEALNFPVDFGYVRELIKTSSLEKVDQNVDASALIVAAQCGKVKIVKKLISLGADIEYNKLYAGSEETALFRAAKYGHEQIVEILCRNGANVNCETTQSDICTGRSPLLFELIGLGVSRMPIMEMLVFYGADLLSGPVNSVGKTITCLEYLEKENVDMLPLKSKFNEWLEAGKACFPIAAGCDVPPLVSNLITDFLDVFHVDSAENEKEKE